MNLHVALCDDDLDDDGLDDDDLDDTRERGLATGANRIALRVSVACIPTAIAPMHR
jgi:hypothetical protein